jgi:DNA-binding transcriptional LysR family regulator
VLDIRRLRLLRELHLRGTIGAVAAALSFSPSSVSQQLALLEREAGVPLLRRSGRRLQLTAHAEVLVEHTTALLERMELMESELLAEDTAIRGTVRLAVFQSAALGIIPTALTLLAEAHPALRVEVTQREPEHALFEAWARDFDLVVAEQYPAHAAPRHPELDRVPLLRDELRLGTPASFGVRTIADARDFPWVMEPRGTASRHFSEQLCRTAGFEPDVRFETADLQAHIRLIESGHAVAVLPDLVWAGAEPTIPLEPLEGHPARDVFTSVRRSSAALASIAAVRDILERAVEGIQA